MRSRFFYFLLTLGFIYRLLLVHLAPQPDIFDQEEYHQFARGILTLNSYDLAVSSYRTFGYPLVLAIIYHFAGIENRWAWIIFQAIMDTATALLVFQIALKIFRKVQPAWAAYIIYLFNPFTSAYVGTRLSEVLTTFAVALIFFLFIKNLQKPNILLMFSLSIALGFLPYIRPGFFFFSVVTFLLTLYLTRSFIGAELSKVLKLLVISISVILFLLPMTYNSLRNLAYFGEFTPLTIHNNIAKDFYLSLIIDNQDTDLLSSETNWVYEEFFNAVGKEERQAMVDKYALLSAEKIRNNPSAFIISRVRHLVTVWHKHNIFPYSDPIFKKYHKIVYWGNNLLLILAVMGFYLWLRKVVSGGKKSEERWFAALVIFLIIYMSIIHLGVMTSGRFTIPAYPILLLFIPISIASFIKRIRLAIKL